MKIAISSGHGAKISGAVGYLNEHDEAVRVVNQVAEDLRAAGVDVETFEDKTSTTQDQNLATIVSWHNSRGPHDYDISVHFNDSGGGSTSKPIGTECWYYSQKTLAADIATAIADSGHLIDRGPKYSSGLYFLMHCREKAALIETAFVNSKADSDLYLANFSAICSSISRALAGEDAAAPPEPVPPDDMGWRENITTTVFAGADDPQDSAYGWGRIDGNKPGAAVPYKWRDSPPPSLLVSGPHGQVVAPVVDVGPWNTNDPDYVLYGDRPIAEDQYQNGQQAQNGQVPTNDAGLDLTPAAAEAVGVDGKGKVKWKFYSAEPIAPPTQAPTITIKIDPPGSVIVKIEGGDVVS